MVKSAFATTAESERKTRNPEPKSHRENNRRSQSLDRFYEQSGSDTKPERKTHKQFMNLVWSLNTKIVHSLLALCLNCHVFFILDRRKRRSNRKTYPTSYNVAHTQQRVCIGT